jgi:hypothetical protein
MAVSTGLAIMIGMGMMTGSSLYSADQQRKAAKDDESRRRQEAAAAKAESDRIARDTRPDEEALAETRFGAEDEFRVRGSTQEFVIPKTSALGTSPAGRSGLGFKV